MLQARWNRAGDGIDSSMAETWNVSMLVIHDLCKKQSLACFGSDSMQT